MFSSVAVSFPRRWLVHRNTRYCSSLSPAVLCLVLLTALRFPVLRSSFSIISFSLFLSLFVRPQEALNSRSTTQGREADDAYTRKASQHRAKEEKGEWKRGKQERGISSARAKASFKECSIIRARKSERSSSIRQDNRILTSRSPFICWRAVPFTPRPYSIPTPCKHTYLSALVMLLLCHRLISSFLTSVSHLYQVVHSCSRHLPYGVSATQSTWQSNYSVATCHIMSDHLQIRFSFWQSAATTRELLLPIFSCIFELFIRLACSKQERRVLCVLRYLIRSLWSPLWLSFLSTDWIIKVDSETYIINFTLLCRVHYIFLPLFEKL